jgi:DNA-binding MarR family transcriptional regulator
LGQNQTSPDSRRTVSRERLSCSVLDQHVHLGLLVIRDHESIYDVDASPPRASFTAKQGQYLAFIYAYTRVLGRPPAEADLQRHFRVSPPSVHQMLLTLERKGLIRRTPGAARSIVLLVGPENLPVLT